MLKELAGVAPLLGCLVDFPFKRCCLKISEDPHLRVQVLISHKLSDAGSDGADVAPADFDEWIVVCFEKEKWHWK